MLIVTTGYRFLDIDALGGCTAYAELLNKLGRQAKAVSTAKTNVSVTSTVKSWDPLIDTTYVMNSDDRYVLIDISEPKYFEKFVGLENVIEVIDHHPGFEKYWHDRIGNKADIEFIGAACTLVFEHWEKSGFLDNISPVNARLLMCGILDNTLNFGAKITSERDRKAYASLERLANLGSDWPEKYFKECQQEIFRDIPKAITDDTKTFGLRSVDGDIQVAQLAVWDAEELINNNLGRLIQNFKELDGPWFINLINIKEKASYFITDNETIKNRLSSLLNLKFNNNIAKASRLWLRKEIIKQDLAR